MKFLGLPYRPFTEDFHGFIEAKVTGLIDEVSCSIGGKAVDIPNLIVLDTLPGDLRMILGNNFFEETDAIINYSDNTLSLNGHTFLMKEF